MTKKSMNRRQFVTGAVASGILAGAAGVPAMAEEAAGQPFEATVDWDAEYDVIVVGFGGAGAAAAITAGDAGAKTLLLEKAPKGESGGNSNVCMQWMCYAEPDDVEPVREYFKAIRGGWDTPSDEIFDVYIQGMLEQKDWLEYLGAPTVTIFDSYIDFPEFPGSDHYKMVTVDGNNGLGATTAGGGGAAYTLFLNAVEARADSIDVWYEAPAKHLIQDPANKIVHGIIAEVADQEVKIRAKNGVVLTCGGYENIPEMQQNFAQRKFWPSQGRALYNEGDGIAMALEINADLWHMGNVVGGPEFYDWDSKTSTFGFGYASPFKGITVGIDGTRAYDGRNAHGKQPVSGEFQNIAVPNKEWYIWDQAMQDMGPANHTWSADSSEEMELGWVMKADSLEELADMIEIPAESLIATIDQYNADCEAGVDRVAGRAASTLLPIATAPFYTCSLTPVITNTQGGPRKNARGEILDTQGNPIPHLYEAGELGDIWS